MMRIRPLALERSDFDLTKAAIIFDLDGTLTRPILDFDAIRAEIGGITGPILEALADFSPDERARAEEILERHEREAVERAELYDGAVEVVAECRRRGYATAVLTRNARANLDRILARFGLVMDTVRTREDGAIKPSAEPVLSICREVGADPAASWMIGDYLFDILSGQAAGTRTVLMIGDGAQPEFAGQADHVITQLPQLVTILDGVSSKGR